MDATTPNQPVALIADDDPVTRLILRAILESRHFSVQEAGDGGQVLSTLSRQRVDLLILDLVMPECDGLEVLNVLRAQKSTTKVIAISGFREGLFLRVAEHLGAHAVVRKPIAEESFQQAIVSALAR